MTTYQIPTDEYARARYKRMKEMAYRLRRLRKAFLFKAWCTYWIV